MDEHRCIRLLTRGDDLGAFQAGNRAIVDAFQHGILRNTSLMVPAPNFQHAVNLVKQFPGLCLGLHITLTSEWDTPRWGPVSPPETVPSLVDQDGYFFRTTRELFHHGVNSDEVIREVKAQLHQARSCGLDIRYLDEHMGIGWIFHPGDAQRRPLNEAFKAIAYEEGLVWEKGIANLVYLPPIRQVLPETLRQLQAGTYLLVTHPTYIDEETQHVIGQEHTQPGGFARSRWPDYQLLCEPEIMRIIDERRIQLIRFDEVAH
ncbi:hypothetical protein KDA_51190 [Dictyobacter alpinus]|uniref:ChbG/HpnK family deacetylase n=1 Tax=Dictyobacter alpinus TaxID=2014873 RepID=A0A402BE43_9CHLR|nr:ChbG/HpnK family deacetylase [Dictyobacter alpinus]GCE29635.1 hypothetical protein KDA_51190 [Dictyobacter alpinus]